MSPCIQIQCAKNNLKYVNRVAYDPIYSKGAPGGQSWFTNIATQQKNKLSKNRKTFLSGSKVSH